MNRASGVLLGLVRGARWGLPWLSLLVVSASIAYAMTAAVASGVSADDASTTTRRAQAPSDALVSGPPWWSVTTSAAIDRFSAGEGCDTSGGRLLYVGLNSWIPAEPTVAPCPESAP
jgi:hypothetical protein